MFRCVVFRYLAIGLVVPFLSLNGGFGAVQAAPYGVSEAVSEGLDAPDAVAAPVVSNTVELPVSADRCAIFYALTHQVAAGCVAPQVTQLGAARRLPPAGFDQAAASLDSAPEEQGYFIRFAFNSNALTEEYKAHLARLGEILTSAQLINACVKLVGHADSVGGPSSNRTLSDSRAKMVAATLVAGSRVAQARIVTEAKGESALLVGLPGPHPLNRRVEILVRDSGGAPCQ